MNIVEIVFDFIRILLLKKKQHDFLNQYFTMMFQLSYYLNYKPLGIDIDPLSSLSILEIGTLT